MTSDTKFLTETHEILGGHAKVYRTSRAVGDEAEKRRSASIHLIKHVS